VKRERELCRAVDWTGLFCDGMDKSILEREGREGKGGREREREGGDKEGELGDLTKRAKAEMRWPPPREEKATLGIKHQARSSKEAVRVRVRRVRERSSLYRNNSNQSIQDSMGRAGLPESHPPRCPSPLHQERAVTMHCL
jgi:hypothetical protein